MKKACIIGITGQTGSYLCDLLLKEGYKVYGLRRRSSSFNTERLDHIYKDPHIDSKLELIYGDLSDYSSLSSLISDTKPDLLFNLGAQSHVRVSFDIPEYTMDVTGTGVIRVLEAIRKNSPNTKFLTASSSEMFGSTPPPQNELTPFHPRSPYGVAKVAGYYSTINYREAYGLHACNAISFNHETVAGFMPVIFKTDINGEIDIKPISEVVNHHTLYDNKIMVDEKLNMYQEGIVEKDLYIWDKNNWTKVKFASGYPHKIKENNKKPRYINAGNSCYLATDTHVVIMENGDEKQIKDINIGDKVSFTAYPEFSIQNNISENEAELLGFIVANSFNQFSYSKTDTISLVSECKNNLELYANIWSNMGGNVSYSKYKLNLEFENVVWRLDLSGNKNWINNFDIYDSYGNKKIPKQILNSNKKIMNSFLIGYNKNFDQKLNGFEFKTSSATLASGLLFLLNNTTGKKFNITIENEGDLKTVYYSAILSNNDNNEVKNILNFENYDGWFYDLETESGTFHCGVGLGHVHNSPRRGETFVTRKITRAATRIKLGLQDKLYLGNLDAKRDWSHAADVANAMYKIITADVPNDYVVSTGEMHSVEEFAKIVFDKLDLNYLDYIKFDANYLRPTEVDALCGDSSKLRQELGWKPEYTLDQLVEEMVDSDLKLAQKEKLLKDNE